jgi:hypothetical protein
MVTAQVNGAWNAPYTFRGRRFSQKNTDFESLKTICDYLRKSAAAHWSLALLFCLQPSAYPPEPLYYFFSLNLFPIEKAVR